MVCFIKDVRRAYPSIVQDALAPGTKPSKTGAAALRSKLEGLDRETTHHQDQPEQSDFSASKSTKPLRAFKDNSLVMASKAFGNKVVGDQVEGRELLG